MSWRYSLIPHLLKDNMGDVYEFGVYSGMSMVDISKAFSLAGATYTTMFGFDSFEGLPVDEEGQHQQEWGIGGFNASKLFQASSVADCVDKTYSTLSQKMNVSNVVLIPGYYDDVLNDELLAKHNFGKAVYIDIDADLYSSTLVALDFMFRNNLVVKGKTIIGYDDWGGSIGWKTNSDGESRAHMEIKKKYNVVDELLFSIGTEYPHNQRLYRIHDYTNKESGLDHSIDSK